MCVCVSVCARARVPVSVCVCGGGGVRARLSVTQCVFTQILLYSTRANRLPDGLIACIRTNLELWKFPIDLAPIGQGQAICE